MHVGILGGTGPAGLGLGVRLAHAGMRVTIGSRDPLRAEEVVAELLAARPEHQLAIEGADNAGAAKADMVVVATPWESAQSTVRGVAESLRDTVVISMANALVREGKEMLALIPPRGSVAAGIQYALPQSQVVAAFHHLPAAQMFDLASGLTADVLICSDWPEATAATSALIERIEGLRPLDAGSLNQAAAIEAFTAVCITLNIHYRAHSTLRLAGI
jgi:NADPH-dependent F420 reductase